MSRHTVRRTLAGGALAAALALTPTAGEAAGAKRETPGPLTSAWQWITQMWENAAPAGWQSAFEAAGPGIDPEGEPAPTGESTQGETDKGPCIDPDG